MYLLKIKKLFHKLKKYRYYVLTKCEMTASRREGDLFSPLPFKMKNGKARIIEWHDNSIPPSCPIHGMLGDRITSCVAVPTQKISRLGGSPGLVVMGGYSCSEGHGFKSQHRMLDGHFSNWFVDKIVMFVCTADENKQKEAGDGPFKKCTTVRNSHSRLNVNTKTGK